MVSYRRASGPPPPGSRYGILLSLISRYPAQLTSFYATNVGEDSHIISAQLCAMVRDGHLRRELDRGTARWYPTRDVGPIDVDVNDQEQVEKLRRLFADARSAAGRNVYKRDAQLPRQLNRESFARVRALEIRVSALEDENRILKKAKKEFDVAMQVLERDFPNVRRERLRLSLESA